MYPSGRPQCVAGERSACRTNPPGNDKSARSRPLRPDGPSPSTAPDPGRLGGRASDDSTISADCVAVVDAPETRFADTNVGRIAYQVVGDGPLDLLVTHPVFPVDLMWDEPTVVRFLDRLSSFSRHIWFDPRGRGASDPLPHEEDRFAESVADDLVALIDHLGLDRVAVLSLAVPSTILFAASHPERITGLVLFNTSARMRWADDYPQGQPADEIGQTLRMRLREWGTGSLLDVLAPSVASEERLRRWLGRAERLMCTADELFWRAQASFEADLRPVLSSIQTPTLVLYRQDVGSAGQARYVAEHIREAKRVELSGGDYLFSAGDTGPMLDAIEEFLTGRLPTHHSDRVLATVLFTDVVESTELVSVWAIIAGANCLPRTTH
jgi:pimeloyl-ACP methyl ester carboxylesterase